LRSRQYLKIEQIPSFNLVCVVFFCDHWRLFRNQKATSVIRRKLTEYMEISFYDVYATQCWFQTLVLYSATPLLNLNPLSPNGDENEISLYIITTCSNIQVTRIKEVITKYKMS